MKRFLQITALALLVTVGSSWRNQVAAQEGDISYQNFYDELSPYGQWIDYPEYGYVWVPSEGPDFRPYSTGGHWVWSDEYDWMWVSDYSWGWAPFHYGRWFYDPFYGWMWVPGYEWAPAWVCWRDGGDYYGWAPLRPGFNLSISIGTYNPPVDYWCFAERRYICSPRIYDYCLDRGRNVTIINNTTIINNYNRRNNVFVTGPRREEAERYAGRISPVRFREASNPGGARFRRNEVSVYRPRVEQNNNRQFTPRSFQRYDRNREQNNGNAIGRDRNNRDNNLPRNGNNLPERGNGRDDSRFDRGNNNGIRQPDNNNNGGNNGNNGRFERGNGFDRRNDQPGNNERRYFEQRNNEAQQQQRANDDRRFDRGNGFDRNRNFNPPQPRQMERPQQQFQPQQRMERPQQQFQPQQRMERPQQQFQPQQRMERPQQQFQPQQRMERPQQQFQPQQRMERPQQQFQPQQRMERPQQQSQPRQFENRGGGNNNHEQRGGGGGNGWHGRRG